MPNVGFSEMVLILLVIVLCVPPEDYPRWLRACGRIWRGLQAGLERLRRDGRSAWEETGRPAPPLPPRPPERPDQGSPPSS